MKKAIIFIVFFLVGAGSYAQHPQLAELLQQSLKNRSNPDSGRYYAEKALALSTQLKDEQGKSLSKMYLGIAYFNSGEIDTAASLLFEVIPDLDHLIFEKGLLHWYIGKVFTRIGNIEKAKGHLIESYEVLQQTDSVYFTASVLNNIGIAHAIQTDYVEALDWFTKAYQMKLTHGKELDTAPELTNISMVYSRMGSYRKALDLTWRSIHLVEGDDDYSKYSSLGGTYNLMGDLDSALIYYNKALAMAKLCGHERHLTNAILNLGSIHYANGEYAKSIEFKKGVLEKQMGTATDRFGVLTDLGKSYRKLEMYDSAKFYLSTGYRLSKKEGIKQWAEESSKFLGFLYSDLNKHDSAFYFLSESMAYADSIHGDRLNELFSDQRVAIETLEKNHEISLLLKENELNTLKVERLIAALTATIILILSLIFWSRNRYKRKELERKELAKALERGKEDLYKHTLHMIHINNCLDDIETEVSQRAEKDITSSNIRILNTIKRNKSLDKDWQNFNEYFSTVHLDFYEKLTKLSNSLTMHDKRVCALVKLELTNREIATILNIEAKSVAMVKYRIKKKLELSEEIELDNFIRSL